ncbi:hypothetical protein H4219_004592 [Mycoemilia scoparia]|uniref:SEC7 domain-containing protein n=1 Tax=Mycoemilia scoparia TaxID=417184 RepID=A0A9W8DQW9_9FUNG|nr:hypothetical protein H4219_004592 [Mycoemilia scoparia]
MLRNDLPLELDGESLYNTIPSHLFSSKDTERPPSIAPAAEVGDETNWIEGGSRSSKGFHKRAFSFGGLDIYDTETDSGYGPQLFDTGIVLSPLDALVARLTTEFYHTFVGNEKDSIPTLLPPGSSKHSIGRPVLSPYIQQFSLVPNRESGTMTPTVSFDGYFPIDSKDKKGTEEPHTGQGRPENTKHPNKPDLDRADRSRTFQIWIKNLLTEACRVSTVGDIDQDMLALLDEQITQRYESKNTRYPPTPTEDLAQFHDGDGQQPPPVPPKKPDYDGGNRIGISGTNNNTDRISSAPPSMPKRYNTDDPEKLALHSNAYRDFSEGAATIRRSPTWDDGMVKSPPPTSAIRPMHIPKNMASSTSGTDPHLEESVHSSNTISRAHSASQSVGRGVYRARDPAAPARRPLAGPRSATRNLKLNIATNRDSFAAISPARLSILRAVGRRQSIRLTPDNGAIVIADAKLKTETEDGFSTPPIGEFDIFDAPKRSNSLSQLSRIPETRRISYTNELERAARHIESQRLPISRRSKIHRAIPINNHNGSKLQGLPSNSNIYSKQQNDSISRHSMPASIFSKSQKEASMLVISELPPPVPLRVRHENIVANPEPIITVRKQLPSQPREHSDSARTRLHLQNQLLGAQAQLHKVILPIHPTAKKHTSGIISSPTEEIKGFIGDPSKASTDPSGHISQQMVDPNQLKAYDSKNKSNSLVDYEGDSGPKFVGPDNNESTDRVNLKRWRSARRRKSTLRTTLLKYTVSTQPHPMPREMGQYRRLLLHGPAFKMLSALTMQPDTYLFLFSDTLIVSRQSSAQPGARTLQRAHGQRLLPPSTELSDLLPDMRFRVQVIIPLKHDMVNLSLIRAGASYRQGETEEQHELRLSKQEKTLRKGCEMFSHNPNDAILYLIKRKLVQPAAEKVAAFLHRCVLLDRLQLANFMGYGLVGIHLPKAVSKEELHEEKQYHKAIWRSFLERCQLHGLPLLEALRVVLLHTNLPLKSGAANAMLQEFSEHWYEKNRQYHSGPYRSTQAPSSHSSSSGGVFKKRSGRKDRKLDTHSSLLEALNSLVSNEPIWVPDNKDVASRLVFLIVNISRTQKAYYDDLAASEREFRDFVSNFRVPVVGDQAQGSRKESVLRKRDQQRVMTMMEAPTEELASIWESVHRFGLSEIFYGHNVSPEFDIGWVRDKNDMYGVGLSESDIQSEIEEVYSDPGHKDGILVNPSSDRIPGKLNVASPYYIRVTIKLPKPDPHFLIGVRVCTQPAQSSPGPGGLLSPSLTAAQQSFVNHPFKRNTVYGNAAVSSIDVTGAPSAAASSEQQQVIEILPSQILQFNGGSANSFIIVPKSPGQVTLQFIGYGKNARCYSPIPARTMLVEGEFMMHTLQVSWAKPKSGANNNASSGSSTPAISKSRNVFGFDSDASKSIWASAFHDALGTNTTTLSDEHHHRFPMYETNPSLSPSYDSAKATAAYAEYITNALQQASEKNNAASQMANSNASGNRSPILQPTFESGYANSNSVHTGLSGDVLVGTVLRCGR